MASLPEPAIPPAPRASAGRRRWQGRSRSPRGASRCPDRSPQRASPTDFPTDDEEIDHAHASMAASATPLRCASTARAGAGGIARAAGRRAGRGSGQAGRAQALELGAGAASAEPGADRLGRRHQEGVERHDHGDAVPVRAARQGVRPLRHGQGRHRRLRLRQPRLPARALPGDGRRRPAVHLRQRQGRLGGDRRLVPRSTRRRR